MPIPLPDQVLFEPVTSYLKGREQSQLAAQRRNALAAQKADTETEAMRRMTYGEAIKSGNPDKLLEAGFVEDADKLRRYFEGRDKREAEIAKEVDDMIADFHRTALLIPDDRKDEYYTGLRADFVQSLGPLAEGIEQEIPEQYNPEFSKFRVLKNEKVWKLFNEQQPKWGEAKPAVVGGKPVFAQFSAAGEVRPVVGATPPQRTSGVSITSPDGTVVEFGPTDKTVTRDIQQKLVDADAQMTRLLAIRRGYQPRFSSAGGQLEAWMNAKIEYLAPEALAPHERAELARFTAWKSATLDNVNKAIKAQTGATMTEPETKRIMATLPGLDDSYTEFTTKLDRVIKETELHRKKMNYYLVKGVAGAQNISIAEFEAAIKQEAAEIEKIVKEQIGDNPAQVKAAVKSELARKYGM